MNNEQAKIRILIVDDDFSEMEIIKSYLDEGMRIPWGYMHCINIAETASRINHADLVILKPEMGGLSSPIQIFNDIKDMTFEVPIIVLAGTNDEHGLSTFFMEKGEAIEFALIRQKETTRVRKDSDKTLQESKNKAERNLQDIQALRSKDIKDSAIKLKDSHDLREKDQEESKRILSMFMSDYSVTDNNKK